MKRALECRVSSAPSQLLGELQHPTRAPLWGTKATSMGRSAFGSIRGRWYKKRCGHTWTRTLQKWRTSTKVRISPRLQAFPVSKVKTQSPLGENQLKYISQACPGAGDNCCLSAHPQVPGQSLPPRDLSLWQGANYGGQPGRWPDIPPAAVLLGVQTFSCVQSIFY